MANLKFDTLHEFLLLSKNKNFSKTADELFIDQSALSRHIAALEDELGVRLITRTKNTFSLTSAGQIVAKEAKIILTRYHRMLHQLSSLSSGYEGELHIGVLYYDIESLIYPVLNRFCENYPKVKLCLHSYQPNQLLEDVKQGVVDAGFGNSMFVEKNDTLNTHFFLREPVIIAFDNSHSFSQKDRICLSDLNGQNIVSFQKNADDQYSLYLRSFFAEHGISVGSTICGDNFDELPLMLKASGGICILPNQVENLWSNIIQSRKLDDLDLAVDIILFWRKENNNPAIKLLLGVMDSL